MTLAELVLANVAEWRPSGGRQTLNIPDQGAGWGVALTADRSDELGCLIWEMTVRRSSPPAERGGVALRTWADRVADRVTGLLEPLKVVEVDVQRDEALLRSEEPATRKEQLFYYEVRLHGGGEAVVQRYRSSHQGGQRREQVAFALTHEAVAKLAADLAAEA